MFHYLPPIWTAGYSGFVLYNFLSDKEEMPCNASTWMIPGTYEYDWDCR